MIRCPKCGHIDVKSNKRPEENEIEVGGNHPDTSHAMRAANLSVSGKKKVRVLRTILGEGSYGANDKELEDLTGFAHESVSSTRFSLMKGGWVRPATKGGVVIKRMAKRTEGIVWVATPAARQWAESQR